MAKSRTRRHGNGKASADVRAVRRANREEYRQAGLLGSARYIMASQVHDTSPEEVDWAAEAAEEMAQEAEDHWDDETW
jgi:hypothetical protein